MAPPRLLDLTRLVSRLGRGALTGVDRVELAYLDRFLKGDACEGAPLFALVRGVGGFALLDAAGAAWVAAAARGQVTVAPAGWLARRLRRGDPLRADAEAQVRRRALALAPVWAVGRLLRRLPAGTRYFNVGHANLTDALLAALQGAGVPVAVLVHDVIPLDHPKFTRPGIPEVFARKMAAVARRADLVIHSTKDARNRTEAQFGRFGRVPPGRVAPLGVPLAAPAPLDLPGLDRARPYFVAVGTIEPRKNHALLLDLWQALAAQLPRDQMPQLVIAGGRGWCNEVVFRRLDARPAQVIEAPGLGDGALVTLLQGSEALLFPSLAEGFGLPPVEAAALGVPVFANPLPVIREVMADYPVYLDASDSYSWLETILQAARSPRARGGAGWGWRSPDWEAHFNTVLSNVW